MDEITVLTRLDGLGVLLIRLVAAVERIADALDDAVDDGAVQVRERQGRR